MPAMSLSPNHSGSQDESAKPMVASVGMSADSHSVGRRPSRCVMAEANGVMRNTPTQPLAANRPASVVDTPSPLSRNSSSGSSMK